MSQHPNSSGAQTSSGSNTGPLKKLLSLLPRNAPKSRLARYALGLALAVSVWAILFGLVLPPIAKHLIVTNVSKSFNAKLELEKLSFNPFLLRLRLEKFLLPYPEGSEGLDPDVRYFAAFDAFEARLSLSSILKLAPVLETLSIRKPRIDMTLLEDGDLSTNEFIRRLPPAAPEQQEASKDKPLFPFILRNLDISDGDIVFRDKVHSSRQEVKNFNLSLPFVSTVNKDSGTPLVPLLTASFGGRDIRMEGKLLPFAESWRAEFRTVLDDIPLENAKAYLRIFSLLELEKGSLGSDIVLSFEQHMSPEHKATGLDIKLNGLVRLENISLTAPRTTPDKPGPQVFALSKGEVEVEVLALTDGVVRVRSLNLDTPMVRATYHQDGSIDWQKFLRPAPTPKSKAKAQAVAAAKQTAPADPAKAGAASSESQDSLENSVAAKGKSNSTAQNSVPQDPMGQNASAKSVAGQNATAQKTVPSSDTSQTLSKVASNNATAPASTKAGNTTANASADSAGNAGNVTGASNAVTNSTVQKNAAPGNTASNSTGKAEAAGPGAGTDSVPGAVPGADGSPSQKAAAQEIPAQRMVFSLQNLDLFNGSIHLRDESIPGGQELTINGFEVHIINVDTQKQMEHFIIAAQPGGNSNLVFEGSANFKKVNESNLLPDELVLKANMELKDWPLSLAGPRVKSLSPLELREGLLGFDAEMTLDMNLKDGTPPHISFQNGIIRVNGLSVYPSGGKEPNLALGSLEFSGLKADVSQRTFAATALKLGKPSLLLRRNAAGEFDLLQALNGQKTPAATPGSANSGKPAASSASPAQSPAKGAASAGSAAPWSWSLSQFNIDDGQIRLLDEGSNSGSTVRKLSLALGNLSSKPGSKISTKLSFNLDATASAGASAKQAAPGKGKTQPAKGKPSGSTATQSSADSGSLNLSGQVVLAPFEAALDLDLNHLPLGGLNPFIGNVGTVQIARGFLQGKVNIQTRAPKTSGSLPDFQLRGSLGLLGFSLVDATKGKRQEIFSVGRGMAEGIAFTLSPLSLGIGSINLNAPKTHLVLERNGLNNLSRAFGATAAKQGSAPAVGKNDKTSQVAKSQPKQDVKKPESPVAAFKKFEISRVELSNGQVQIRDERLGQPVHLAMNDISIKVGKLAVAGSSGKGAQTPFSLTANLDGVPLNVQGTIDPLAASPGADLKIDLKDFDLMPLGGYFAEYIGYPLHSGVLTSQSSVKLDDNKLNMSIGLEVSKFTFGDRIKDTKAPSIPLGLAVSMLTDLNGVISLTLPISGNLDDPQFRSGGIIMGTLGNILIKVVASPLTLVGNVFGGIAGGVAGLVSSGSSDLQFLPFAPGDARLTPESKKIVEVVVKLMQQKPGLNLKMQGCSDAGEKQALVEARIMAKMRQLKYEALPSKERRAIKPEDIVIDREKDPQEYDDLLFDVYADEPFDKPGTFGLTKRVSVDEMWQRIREGNSVDDGDLRELALARARNVRQYFIDLDPKMIPRTNLAELLSAQTPKPGEPGFNRVNLVTE